MTQEPHFFVISLRGLLLRRRSSILQPPPYTWYKY